MKKAASSSSTALSVPLEGALAANFSYSCHPAGVRPLVPMKMKCSREGTCFFSSSAKSMYWSWRKSDLAPDYGSPPISSGRASLKLSGTNVKPDAGMEMKYSCVFKAVLAQRGYPVMRGEAEAVKGVADTPCFFPARQRCASCPFHTPAWPSGRGTTLRSFSRVA